MNDRELLELAAKAAGFVISKWGKTSGAFINNKAEAWSPLTNDGDAFRLCVSLDIGLRLNGDELTGIAHWFRNGKSNRVVGNYFTGNGAQARRLIVRAAAEIGKAMQEQH